MSRLTHKTLAVVAAATLATAAPLVIAPSSPVAVAQNTGSINVNADVSLTIDKRLGEVGSTQNLEGISFKVERVNMTEPLNTQDGWEEVNTIVAAGPSAATVTSEEFTVKTGPDGKAVFPDVKVGLYRVTELQNGNYTVAAPFFVTLPLMENGVPNYNPTISPKNQLLKPTKAAADTNVTIGKNITYTIKAPVPAGDVLRDGTRTLQQFRIEDQLQSNLALVNNPAAKVTLTGAGADPITPAADDYEVTYDNNTLVVTFTETGLRNLAALRADNPNLTAQVVFEATVNSIPANGQINNTANVYIPNADTPIQTTPETTNDGTDTVRTQYVDVAVTKTIDGQPVVGDTTGNGAQFQIFKCTSGDGNNYKVADGEAAVAGTNAAGDATAEATLTAAGGAAPDTAAVANGYALQFDPEATYCAVETKAPAGYLINPDPTPLTRVDNAATTAGRPIYTATINDVKDNLFGRLPATGERTMIALLALGLVLFAGGAYYQLRRKNA